MKLRIWQVDAFAERPFAGNPAAIMPLRRWLPDSVLQAIANENNLAETAFFIAREPGYYDLRWFTPAAEVELCGHATLASAWVIFSELEPALEMVRFSTKSGILTVEKCADGLNRMSLPADRVAPFAAPPGFADKLGKALGVPPPEGLYTGRYLMAVWEAAAAVRAIAPQEDFVPLLRQTGMWGLIATGRGDSNPYDCVSRFFATRGVEDPVTGSAHCAVIPFWAKRLGKMTLRAYQASARGGDLLCTDEDERVILSGPCALYLRGEIEI
jgi:PhzF family phenazine biosynthesis protein